MHKDRHYHQDSLHIDTNETTQTRNENTLPTYTISPDTDDEYTIQFNDTTNDSDTDYESDTSLTYQLCYTSLTELLQNRKKFHYKTIMSPKLCMIFTLQQETNTPEQPKRQPLQDHLTSYYQGTPAISRKTNILRPYNPKNAKIPLITRPSPNKTKILQQMQSLNSQP